MSYLPLRLTALLFGTAMISFGIIPTSDPKQVMALITSGSCCLFIASMRSVDIRALITFLKSKFAFERAFFNGNADYERFNTAQRLKESTD